MKLNRGVVSLERVLLVGALAFAGVAFWQASRDPEPVVEPVPDRVVGVTLFCRTSSGVFRDEACMRTIPNATTGITEWRNGVDRYYEVSVRTPDGQVYTVEYPAVSDVQIGDDWPNKTVRKAPYAEFYEDPE